MPTYDTPTPIAATIDIGVGRVRLLAGARTDTVVDVQPSDPSSDADVKVVGETRVELVNGKLSVTAPRQKTWRAIFGRPGSIDVTVELPEDSQVDVKVMADVRCEGRLGEAAFDTAVGPLHIDETGRLKARTAAGEISVGRANGPADVSTATGRIRIDEIEGSALVKTSNGDVRLGEVTGDVRLTTANGDIAVGVAHAGVEAKTAAGNIRVDEVVQGNVVLKTGFGNIEVGVREGTAAWLDISSARSVRSDLDPSGEPGPGDPSVEIHAATGWGDIVVRRPTSTAPAA